MQQSGERTSKVIILGAGVTGLAAGLATGCTIFEAASTPAGICTFYYIKPGAGDRSYSRARESVG